jgi:hypothetical protein
MVLPHVSYSLDFIHCMAEDLAEGLSYKDIEEVQMALKTTLQVTSAGFQKCFR